MVLDDEPEDPHRRVVVFRVLVQPEAVLRLDVCGHDLAWHYEESKRRSFVTSDIHKAVEKRRLDNVLVLLAQ